VKVAELGSIRRAADVLNVASSAINRKILNLEKDLGLALFRRTSKGVVPTSAGILLLRHARETLGDFQRTIDEIVSQTGELKGSVRIMGLGSIIDRILPDIIAGLAKTHTGVSFHVLDESPDNVVEALKTGHVDIGITFLDRRHRELQMCAHLNTTVGAVMRSDHPLAIRSSVTLTECAAYDSAMFSDRWTIMPLVESEFQQTGAEFKPRITTNSMAIMRAAILHGIGIGFFTPIGFIEEIRQGEINFVPLRAGNSSPDGIGLFASQGALTSPAVRAIIDRLSEVFSDLQSALALLESPKLV
jgi:DNA-binding transcriptional LysR family regulator